MCGSRAELGLWIDRMGESNGRRKRQLNSQEREGREVEGRGR